MWEAIGKMCVCMSKSAMCSRQKMTTFPHGNFQGFSFQRIEWAKKVKGGYRLWPFYKNTCKQDVHVEHSRMMFMIGEDVGNLPIHHVTSFATFKADKTYIYIYVCEHQSGFISLPALIPRQHYLNYCSLIAHFNRWTTSHPSSFTFIILRTIFTCVFFQAWYGMHLWNFQIQVCLLVKL